MNEEELAEKYFNFPCVIKHLIASQIEVEWEIPYEIENLPDDLSRLNDGDIKVEYWLKPSQNIKNKKITPLRDKNVYGLVLLRTICISINKTLSDFEHCAV